MKVKDENTRIRILVGGTDPDPYQNVMAPQHWKTDANATAILLE